MAGVPRPLGSVAAVGFPAFGFGAPVAEGFWSNPSLSNSTDREVSPGFSIRPAGADLPAIHALAVSSESK